jgi:hypothetical protein
MGARAQVSRDIKVIAALQGRVQAGRIGIELQFIKGLHCDRQTLLQHCRGNELSEDQARSFEKHILSRLEGKGVRIGTCLVYEVRNLDAVQDEEARK